MFCVRLTGGTDSPTMLVNPLAVMFEVQTNGDAGISVALF